LIDYPDPFDQKPDKEAWAILIFALALTLAVIAFAIWCCPECVF
jgi:hypothetical protein